MARPRLLTGAQRLNEATTSAALISSPLWNGTPWRRVIVFVSPSSLTSMPLGQHRDGVVVGIEGEERLEHVPADERDGPLATK